MARIRRVGAAPRACGAACGWAVRCALHPRCAALRVCSLRLAPRALCRIVPHCAALCTLCRIVHIVPHCAALCCIVPVRAACFVLLAVLIARDAAMRKRMCRGCRGCCSVRAARCVLRGGCCACCGCLEEEGGAPDAVGAARAGALRKRVAPQMRWVLRVRVP